ncbi:hypothetical protein [Microvirga roseola]|nr:hypothetical protein [Microvirga roseola]
MIDRPTDIRDVPAQGTKAVRAHEHPMQTRRIGGMMEPVSAPGGA